MMTSLMHHPQNRNALPAIPVKGVLNVATMAQKCFSEAEAELSLELDRIQDLSAIHPLGALDQVVALMHALNLELLKCLAPRVLDQAQQSALFEGAASKTASETRDQMRALASMLKVQEAITKLGAARVRIHDELGRRTG